MEAVIAGARAVIAMAGYNTVAELVRAGKPSLLVPRVRPSEEQLVRATALARAGSVMMLHPAELTPPRLRSMLDTLLDQRSLPHDPAEHDGARNAAEILVDLASRNDRAAVLARTGSILARDSVRSLAVI